MLAADSAGESAWERIWGDTGLTPEWRKKPPATREQSKDAEKKGEEEGNKHYPGGID